MSENEALVAMGKEITPVPGGSVQVTAPTDLPAGYVLAVNVNGSVRNVRVPEDVKEGQSFQAIPDGVSTAIPTGQWRDGLFDCCRYGCCEPMCCLGLWLQPILVGQIMTRMSRDWCGFRGDPPSISKTCIIVTYLFFGVTIIQSSLSIALEAQGFCLGGELSYDFDKGQQYIRCPDGSHEKPTPTFQILNSLLGLIGSLFAIYIFLNICRTRAAMRAKFNIPTGACGGCEDCCCAWCCSFCTLTQMARHTHDYQSQPIPCCSSECINKRGQPDDVPEIDV